MTDVEDTYRNDHRLNSRPLDVHRWSDHPEVKQLIDRLRGGFVEAYPEHVAVFNLRLNNLLTVKQIIVLNHKKGFYLRNYG